MKSNSGKFGGDHEQIELLVAPLVGPKNSEGEGDSDSPFGERSKSRSLVSSRTRTRG